MKIRFLKLKWHVVSSEAFNVQYQHSPQELELLQRLLDGCPGRLQPFEFLHVVAESVQQIDPELQLLMQFHLEVIVRDSFQLLRNVLDRFDDPIFVLN